jgi:hypothetical protein
MDQTSKDQFFVRLLRAVTSGAHKQAIGAPLIARLAWLSYDMGM